MLKENEFRRRATDITPSEKRELSTAEKFAVAESRFRIVGVHRHLIQVAKEQLVIDPSVSLEVSLPKKINDWESKNPRMDFRFQAEEVIHSSTSTKEFDGLHENPVIILRSKGIRVEVDAGLSPSFYYADTDPEDPSLRRQVLEDVLFDAKSMGINDKREIRLMQRKELHRRELDGWKKFRTDLPLEETMQQLMETASTANGYFDFRNIVDGKFVGTTSQDTITRPIEIF